MAKKTKSDTTPTRAARGVDLEEVERVLEFMQKHRLEQFEYERDGVHLMLKKAPIRRASEFREEPAPPPRASGPVEEPVAVSAHAVPAQAGAAKLADEELHVVKSPIVGTFYGAPSPGADPFVTVGVHVQTGQVLCIIEAMKLMNEIEADIAGEIVKIYVENGHPVEYGERLFGIRAEGKK